jgi:hypothetical protein
LITLIKHIHFGLAFGAPFALWEAYYIFTKWRAGKHWAEHTHFKHNGWVAWDWALVCITQPLSCVMCAWELNFCFWHFFWFLFYFLSLLIKTTCNKSVNKVGSV